VTGRTVTADVGRGTIATCNKCKKFSVPWDEIGKALMLEHLRECRK
jgi:hypothetical protein